MTYKTPNLFRRLRSDGAIGVALMVAVLTFASVIACSSTETIVETVVVEKEVPGPTIYQTVVVEKEVAVSGETVVHTVVVEKEVVAAKSTSDDGRGSAGAAGPSGQPGEPGAAGAPGTSEAPGETTQRETIPLSEPEIVIVEVERIVEVVKEVEVEKIVEIEIEKLVEAEAAAVHPTAAPEVVVPAPAATAAPMQAQQSQPQHQPSATTFQNTLRSPFVLTAHDDTSTFSLDTDRTSFQLALNWARSGYEVDPASVRAEEWVNAFNYDYDPPRHRDSFNIQTDIIPHPLDPLLHIGRIAFQAPEMPSDMPLNVTLVLDGSGSMSSGNRVMIAREAAEAIRSSMGDDDLISVVHFDDRVKDGLTERYMKPSHVRVQESIMALEPDGGTNVQAGLNRGVELANEMRRRRPDALNYIILMSDGVANVDATNPFAILESAADHNPDNPLRLITIGVGIENYNDVLLEQLAQHGNGWYRYLSEPEEGRMLFDRENWLALSVPFADQTRAQVTWNQNNVNSWRLIGYENRVTSDESFTQAMKKFAEIPAGTATTVFFELELNAHVALEGYDTSLGTVELRWVTPSTGDGNRQHAVIEPKPPASDQDLAMFGAIVALAADRYSGLNEYSGETPGMIHLALSDLAASLGTIQTPFANSNAYQDFQFVLNSMVGNTEPPPRTGYSR